ncbi:hypothetical protein [Brachybacterium fresconis]|uniref:ATP/GTP-binding protein n=1 Tax=Brachybacterium fresconis TaxID=173363 RepID=A0ABS4YFC4_9MICO|nr:hypothetical protein [Brachybacterium fresconis]MBP2407310.1 hypothetical protein [Brachybacterium fresconis]
MRQALRVAQWLTILACTFVLLLTIMPPALATKDPVNVGGSDSTRIDETTVTGRAVDPPDDREVDDTSSDKEESSGDGTEKPSVPAEDSGNDNDSSTGAGTGSNESTRGQSVSADDGERASVHEYNDGNPATIAVPGLEDSWATVTEEKEDLKELRANCLRISLIPLSRDCMDLTSSADGDDSADTDPSGGPAARPSPAEVAQTAVSQMHLVAPQIASAPNDPDTLGAVGLPVWLWVANPGPTTTGPNSTSATAGDVTVTATATFSGMTIDMGDGTTIECTGPGTEYPGTGIEESPDCGHVYEQMSDDQPGGLYTVNITAHWAVDWESNSGEGGQIPVDLTTDKQLRIGSYQSVVTDVT